MGLCRGTSTGRDLFAMAKVLIVDDDSSFRKTLRETIADLGHEAWEAGSVREGKKLLAEADVVFLDLRLPDQSGLSLLQSRSEPPRGKANPALVIVTAYAEAENVIEAMKLGAFDHLEKPVGRKEIEDVLRRALARPVLPRETRQPSYENEVFVGSSPLIRRVQKLVGIAASSEVPVLVQGETGTGKEVVARMIHRHSHRSDSRFVPVNCAAIPKDLLESELFGHVRGAFTGAVRDRVGKLQEAHGGTLFLDEIGDMPLEMQAKLLRVLEERVITPLGGSKSLPCDFRLIAATHRDLISAVQEGRFREDLYYRVAVFPIRLPPLRERGSDMLALAEYFLWQACPNSPKKLSPRAAAKLLEYPWPGNVRELRNLMQLLSLTVRGTLVEAEDIQFSHVPEKISTEDLAELDYATAMERLERSLIAKALETCHGNRSAAARRLGIRRQLLYEKLKRYRLGPFS
jgi:two-component system NtrC family response regulator